MNQSCRTAVSQRRLGACAAIAALAAAAPAHAEARGDGAAPVGFAAGLAPTGSQVAQATPPLQISVLAGTFVSHVVDNQPTPEFGYSVARAADIVGNPVTLRRRAPAGVVGKGGIPSRLPLSVAALTSGFGARYHPILGGLRAHSGVDLAAPTGSPVRATADGVVGSADWRGGYGLMVEVNHGAGRQTRYAHMSQLAVAPGQAVKNGQVIGYVGSTGRSTGPHLHYELRVNGQAVNPLSR